MAEAADPIMPLSQVQPGMQCTGETVISGIAISSFAVNVMSVVQAPPQGRTCPLWQQTARTLDALIASLDPWSSSRYGRFAEDRPAVVAPTHEPMSLAPTAWD